METITPSSLAAELIAAAPSLTEREQHLAIELYRVLAEGEPVEAAVLADRAQMGREEVEGRSPTGRASSPTSKAA